MFNCKLHLAFWHYIFGIVFFAKFLDQKLPFAS